MRPLLFCIILAGCSTKPPVQAVAAAPEYAPAETVTVRASGSETTRRIVALYASENIPVLSATGSTVTTAQVHRVALASARASGTIEYFFRATVTGSDTVSAVSLALWGRMVTTTLGNNSAGPDQPITSECTAQPVCAALLTRMRAHAAALRK